MFKYTDAFENVNSSLVDAVYYNDNDKTMLVRLFGGKQYVYDKVQRFQAADIALGVSPGAEYNFFRRSAASPGKPNHDSTVVPDDTLARASAPTGSSADVSALPEFKVEYELLGQVYNSAVEAPTLIDAVQDVFTKLNSLGLQPTVRSAELVS